VRRQESARWRPGAGGGGEGLLHLRGHMRGQGWEVPVAMDDAGGGGLHVFNWDCE
jgi:hypothetical protein